MIVCPNCNHQNPEGASQCEACYAPLPTTIGCPNCGASVQSDATFCGQCGFNLQAEISQNFGVNSAFAAQKPEENLEKTVQMSDWGESEIPVTIPSMSIPSPWDDDVSPSPQQPHPREPVETEFNGFDERVQQREEPLKPTSEIYSETTPLSYAETESEPFAPPVTESYEEPVTRSYNEPVEELYEEPVTGFYAEPVEESYGKPTPDPFAEPVANFYAEPVADPFAESLAESYTEPAQVVESEPKQEEPVYITPPATPPKASMASLSNSATQLQIQTVSLYHIQTNTTVEIPQHLSIIHLGKPNSQIPPDVDVSGFPNSEIVSRVHADIRVEGDAYFLEDMGSSNGTYINHTPLLAGNRHRLRTGDRIALGKGDKVTFIFQIS
jgi:pSer/pThr/pTyr-binding forkhead associated (FHA) protein